MLPTIPFYTIIIFFLISLFYIWFGTYKTESMSIEIFSVSVTFIAIITGFILSVAFTRIDTTNYNKNQFIQMVKKLNYYINQNNLFESRQILIELIKNYINGDSSDIKTLFLSQKLIQSLNLGADDPVVSRLILGLLDNYEHRFFKNEIPNVIWYAVLINISIISFFVVIDGRIQKPIASLILVLIWLIFAVIYYLYFNQEKSIKSNILELLQYIEVN